MKKAWRNELKELPKKDGEYICMVKWYNTSKYVRCILLFKNGSFQVTDSAEHIFWKK